MFLDKTKCPALAGGADDDLLGQDEPQMNVTVRLR
jgi:hypothetical protein